MSPRRADPKLRQQQPQSGLPTWAIAIGIGTLVVVAAVVLFTLQTPGAPVPGTSASSPSAVSRTKGDPNAKIELIDFSDFQ